MVELEVSNESEPSANDAGSPADLRREFQEVGEAVLRGLEVPASQPRSERPRSTGAITVEDNKPETTDAPETTESSASTESDAASEQSDAELFDLGEGLPPATIDEIREAMKARGDFDQAHEGLVEKQAKFERAARSIEAEKQALAERERNLNSEFQKFRDKAAAWSRIEPLLLAGDVDAVMQMVQNFKAGGGAPAAAPASDPDAIRNLIREELGQVRKEAVLTTIDDIAGSMIESDPKLRVAYSDIKSDTVDRLKRKLVAEANAGNITSRSTESEIRKIVSKHLEAMRVSDVARAKKLAGVPADDAKKQVRVVGKLGPVSRTPGTRAPGKPNAMKVDYGAVGSDADREFSRFISQSLFETEAATRS